MYRLALVVVLILISLASMSQEMGNTPINKKAKRIASRITKNKKTDFDKVSAIYEWICKNIKYDFKKANTFDYREEKISKVLCHHKATCKGYSELFYYMCNLSGVKVVKISGYSKNINVDVNDKLYLEDHQWNAALIDSTWRLFDVCWDAGYIKYTKHTIFGRMLYILTLGKHTIIKYKPHFVSYPQKKYFNRDGRYFITDHISGNPLWQLLNPIKTIKEFESDSSYYYDVYDYKLSSPDNLNNLRLNYFNQANESQLIQDGLDKYQFNNKNQYPIAISNYLLAKINFYKLSKIKIEDSLKTYKMIDTVNLFLQKSFIHLDSNAYFLSNQKKELFHTNLDKKCKFKFDHDIVHKSTNKSIFLLKSSKRICSTAKKTIKTTNKILSIRHDRFKNNLKFSKAKFSKMTNVSDSTIICSEIYLLNDSINLLDDSIRQNFIDLNNLYSNIILRIAKYSKQVESNIIGTKFNSIKRISGFDNYDFEIIIDKNIEIENKLIGDSLLLVNSEFIIKTYNKELIKLKYKLYKLFQLHKKVLNDLCSLKKVCSPDDKLKLLNDYNNNILEYELGQYLPQLNELNDKFENLEETCLKQLKPSKKELKEYKNEKRIETKMFRIRQSYYSNLFSSLIKINRLQKYDDLKLVKDLEKFKRRNKIKYDN